MTDEKLASMWFAARDEAEHAEPGTNVTPLRAFARRIAEIEREECAKVCDAERNRGCSCTSCDCGNQDDAINVALWDEQTRLAAAIRARGGK